MPLNSRRNIEVNARREAKVKKKERKKKIEADLGVDILMQQQAELSVLRPEGIRLQQQAGALVEDLTEIIPDVSRSLSY